MVEVCFNLSERNYECLSNLINMLAITDFEKFCVLNYIVEEGIKSCLNNFIIMN